MSNILATRAMLVRLTVRQWGSSKMDRRVTRDVTARENASADAARVTKSLLPKSALAAIKKVVSSARQITYLHTLPWLDDGMRILPAKAHKKYTKAMRPIQDDWRKAVAQFLVDYQSYVGVAQQRLGTMFDAGDYPSAAEVAERFELDVQIFQVPDDGDFRANVSKADADAIRASIRAATDKALREATREPWQRIAGMVGHMAQKLADYVPPTDGAKAEGIWRDSLVTNVRELASVLPALNVSDDPALADAAKVLAEISAHAPDALRDDPIKRKAVADAAAKIQETADTYL
jgi:hypothetical protein